MAPTLMPGDYLISWRSHQSRWRIGQIVLLRHPHLGTLVKRISSVDQQGLLSLEGDNPASSSSQTLGHVSPDAVIGRVIWRTLS